MTGSPQTSRAARRLSDVRAGEIVRVAGVDSGHALRMRLLAIGLSPGATVRMMQRHRIGPCILAVRGARLALGRGMLSRIRVEPVS